MNDEDLTATLNGFAIAAINRFLFPKMPLTYEYEEAVDPLDNTPYGYYFVDQDDIPIGQPEYQVILAFMKCIWIENRITDNNNFNNPFFDKDIKGYSPANMLAAMKNMKESYEKSAEKIAFNYGRVNKDGKTVWGTLNG